MRNNPYCPELLRLCVISVFFLFSFQSISQTIIGPSLHQRSNRGPDLGDHSNNRAWLEYTHHFTFKKGMAIDSDFGHQFFENGKKRLSVRSVFLYDIHRDWKIGGGMGFFWNYDTPNLEQELRFVQQVQHRRDLGNAILQQRFVMEERISQAIETGDHYQTRWRYLLGFTFPTASPFYFGFHDEVFGHIGRQESDSFIATNRLIGFVGHQFSEYFKLEGRIMMENEFSKLADSSSRSWVVGLSAIQVF